jgi:hypothetical protein
MIPTYKLFIFVIFITLALALILLLFINNISEKYEIPLYVQTDYLPQPNLKNIFCFWHDDKLSPLINACINKTKKQLPDWKVILLNSKTIYNLIDISKFPKNYMSLHIQAKADWIRLYLIYNYGGLWMDCSIIVNDADTINNLYNKLVNTDIDFIFYENPAHAIIINNIRYPCAENWFLLAKPKVDFIGYWLSEFELAINMSLDNYAIYANKNFILPNTDISEGIYHTAYKCCLIAFQKNKNINMNNFYVLNAHSNMYILHIKHRWSSARIFKDLLKNKNTNNIKLIGINRKFIEKRPYKFKQLMNLYFN